MRGLLSLALAAATSASPMIWGDSIQTDPAPILSSTNAVEIPDSYIIKFKSHVNQNLAAAHHDWVQDVHLSTQSRKAELRKRSQSPMVDDIFRGLKHTYNIAGGMLGYSGHFDKDVIEQIRRHPDVSGETFLGDVAKWHHVSFLDTDMLTPLQVELIERDQEVHTLNSTTDPELEKNAPWGLARISHRDSLSFGTFNKYYYTVDGGEGVDVYVIDTGTNIEHVDFEGRAEWGATIPEGDADEDGNGHGTHCSGTIAGKKYGVAKKANVKAVKVLRSNGSGSMADVVKGVEFAAESHLEKVEAAKSGSGKSKSKKFKGSAANMSLGGGKSAILDQAVNAAVDAGIHFAVAAGNDNADSCNYSPAAADKAVTVGASTLADTRAYFSNYGSCNDLFAPGLNILSTWIGSKYAVNTISGTSMASPHIAGLLAYLLSLQPSKDSAYAVADITPKQLKGQLISIATEGMLTDVPSDTQNILAWNGGGKSNYSSIIDDGGYTAGAKEINIDFGKIEEEIVDEAARVNQKAHLISKEIEDFVSEELNDLFEELDSTNTM